MTILCMCGIAGVIAWSDKYRTSRGTLARMSAAIAHRGPDGEGMWFNHEGEATPDRPQAALAHRRLAIIDPDPRANQPFTDGQGHWIVFNGEIYNFRELRKELEQLDGKYEWRTTCDTEVLLRAYAQWGEKCVERLNGMFAFAVWDENAKELFLARDRMGQKPLYYSIAPASGAVAFASELRSIQAATWIKRGEPPAASVGEYLLRGYVLEQSFARDVRHLPPGTRVTYAHARGREQRYFEIDFTPKKLRIDRPFSVIVRDLVMRSVERQLVSDVPLGCFLSGGVDSSVIAAAIRNTVPRDQRVLTFSIGFEDPRYDETAFAARVAAHLGTEHRQFIVRANAAEDLPRLAAVFGEPFGDSSALPTHYLARETRAHVKVALSGDGADELFAGYDRYRAMRLAEQVRFLTSPLPWMALAPILQRMPSGHPKSWWNRVRRFATGLALAPARRYTQYTATFDLPLIHKLLNREWATAAAEADAISQASSVRWPQWDAVRGAMACDQLTYLPGDLLTKVDRASMLHALEVRSPFMDHELVQFAAMLLPFQLLDGGPKRMLREAFAADLPEFVFKRPKMGFAVPIGEWFRGELRPMLRDHLFAADSFARGHFNMPVVERMVDEHEHERIDHSQRLYALLMLELWWRLQG